jgi:hypothetical protein
MRLNDLLSVLNPADTETYLRGRLGTANWRTTALYAIIGAFLIAAADLFNSLFTTGIVNIGGAVVIFFFTLASGLAAFFILNAVLYVIAKALGGEGDLRGQLFLQAIVFLAISPLSAVLAVSMAVPFIDCIFLSLWMVLQLYHLFLTFKVISVAHNTGSTRSLMIVGLYLGLLIVLALSVFLLSYFLGASIL